MRKEEQHNSLIQPDNKMMEQQIGQLGREQSGLGGGSGKSVGTRNNVLSVI